jgi:GNAT superfamily N-acetyltransferase
VNNILVRPAKVNDFENWLILWDAYNEFYGRVGPTALSAKCTQIAWARFFDQTEPVHALVAEADNELVGLAHYLFHRSISKVEPVCYLQDLYTVPKFRSKGIGKALIEEVYKQAQLVGTRTVYWHTQETNETAMRLYNKVAERSGFVVYKKKIELGI